VIPFRRLQSLNGRICRISASRLIAVESKEPRWISGDGPNDHGVVTMQAVLIVEDNIADMRSAAAVLKRLGVTQVDAVRNVGAAIVRLEDAIDGIKPAPSLVLLDLDFACESGFEVLRFWKSHPELKNTRIVVWTSMDDPQVEMCHLFGVDVVRKGTGLKELDESLRPYFFNSGQNSAAS
jgi:CheY-like chemotaxis protein